MMMLPSLIRLFAASEARSISSRAPRRRSTRPSRATDYVNYAFWNDNPGFLILYGAMKDALTLKTGFREVVDRRHQGDAAQAV